jgi:malate dehydrogenase (oxaloacetate-decarboxylating)
MITLNAVRDPQTGVETIEAPFTGSQLLEAPIFNKGSAFPEDERRTLGLMGLLPPHTASMEEQLARTYENYQQKESAHESYVFLSGLHDRNETLFYRLVQEHFAEMLPIVYAPGAGMESLHYSHTYRRPRGLYLAYPHRDALETMLRNAPFADVRQIVVTDGEHVMGLGDQGIGGMAIAVGKLALSTLCAGVHPAKTLPIVLDAGVDNRSLLNDPLYLGWRHERIRGGEYEAFVEAFVQAVQQVFPSALLQWEDFNRYNARQLLDRYRDRLATFNDDIQGTGAAALAGILAALQLTGAKLEDQRIVIRGAGTVANGVYDLLVAAMVGAGRSKAEARAAIWMVDSHGPLHEGRMDLDPFKRRYAQPLDHAMELRLGRTEGVTLLDVVQQVQPTILIGAAARPGAFTSAVVREMARYVERPIILPLSNPAARSEAAPSDLLEWTNGRALIATGSAFPDVRYLGQRMHIGQCSSIFIFPGVALGAIVAGAQQVTDGMLVAAARALSELSPSRQDDLEPLYPAIDTARDAAKRVALAVALEAGHAGVAEPAPTEELSRRIAEEMWEAKYPRLAPKL